MPSPIEDGLDSPWYRLRLPADLEARYRAQADPRAARSIRSWLLVFILFNLLSLWVDLDLFGPERVLVPAALTLGLFVPVALAAYFCLSGQPSPGRQTAAVSATALTDVAIILNSARMAPGTDADTYVILAAITPLVVGMIAPLSFRHALWFCLGAFGLYAGLVAAFGLAGEGHAGIPFLVAALILVPLKLAYTRERETKRHFLAGLRERRQAEELERANARLTVLSQTDPLTGLANRRLFGEGLERAWAAAHGDWAWIGVALIDVDHFKALNDSAGHAEGDRCLRRIAEALGVEAAAWGGMVARYGGEEFAAFLPAAEPEAALAFGDALRRRVVELALPHPGLGPGAAITVSVGVTAAHGATRAVLAASDLVEAADGALYEAKRRGRNRVEGAACRAGTQAETAA